MTSGTPSGRIPATLIPGDGIGPEISEVVVAVLQALGAPFAWDVQQGGLAGIESAGDPLPGALLDSIRRTKLALKGPLTTPVGGGFRSVNVRLREEFHLYANLRPAHTLVPGGGSRTSTSSWCGRIWRGSTSPSSTTSRSATTRMRWRSRRASTPGTGRGGSRGSPSSMRSSSGARRSLSCIRRTF